MAYARSNRCGFTAGCHVNEHFFWSFPVILTLVLASASLKVCSWYFGAAAQASAGPSLLPGPKMILTTFRYLLGSHGSHEGKSKSFVPGTPWYISGEP